jgi:hypothetical protein
MRDSLVTRLLGGSPLTVLIRLGALSLVVGAFMAWIGIDAVDLLDGLQRGFIRLYGSGFTALHELGRTLLAGAAVVVPVWLVLRLLSYRGPQLRRPAPDEAAPASRWGNPERVGDDRRI